MHKIWKADKVLNEEGKVGYWVSEELELILNGKSKSVASGIRRSAKFHNLPKIKREPIDKCAIS